MRIRQQGKNQIAIILSQQEMKTIDFLTHSGNMVHFVDAREFIEMTLQKAVEYLEHYKGVANHGDTVT